MWIELAHAADAVVRWLPTITIVARALTAVTGLVLVVARAVHWWRTRS